MKNISRLAVALALILGTSTVGAATVQDQFDVTLTVENECTVNAGDLNFGTAGGQIDADIDATSTITVNCNPDAAYNVLLNAGTGTGSSVADRYMNDGANVVQYQLYRDAGRTQVWGETIGTDTLSGTGNGADQSLTVYGRVLAGQSIPAGNYVSTVTATVDY